MKVLVVKMSSMGDIVHAQPVVSDLLAHAPHARIDWVAEAPFAGIPAMNPGVASVFPIAWRRWRRTLREPATRAALRVFRDRLQATRYDWIVDCQGLLKSAVVSRLARGEHRAGPSWSSAREPLASLAYDRRARVPWSLHVVARNRAIAAQALGYRIDGPARFGLRVPALVAGWLPAGPPTAVLIPGASRPEKLWPEAHWVAVGRQLAGHGLRLAWLWGSPEERARVQRLAAACGVVLDASGAGVDVSNEGASPTSVIPPFVSVADAASLVAGARLVVGLDTGFTHLAGALGRSTVGIFCDFDATQCAVSGDGPCESFGGVGVVPPVAEVAAAIERMLGAAVPAAVTATPED